MTASSQPKLCVIHTLVHNLKHTSIVAGAKIAQLMAMSIGPRFLSPVEGIISALSIAAAAGYSYSATLRAVRAAAVQSSLESLEGSCRNGAERVQGSRIDMYVLVGVKKVGSVGMRGQ